MEIIDAVKPVAEVVSKALPVLGTAKTIFQAGAGLCNTCQNVVPEDMRTYYDCPVCGDPCFVIKGCPPVRE
jgi:Zn finger protein HypA/HybF involved in hydrogenase expression